MANGFLPNFITDILPQRVDSPALEIQNSLAGQAAANVAARRQAQLGARQQIAEQQASQLVPQTTAQLPAIPAQTVAQATPQFISRQPALDPNQVIARRPGGMITVPTGQVIRRQEPTAGEIEANADVTEQQARLVGAQQELMDQQANWMAKRAETQEKLVDIEQGAQARMLEKEKRKSAALQEGLTKLNTLTDKVGTGEIKDFWADKSTGSKILATIGMALGGALQGLRGGPNPALQILNQRIEADLAKQKANLNKGYQDIEAQKSLLAETSKIYDNDIIAEDAARAAAYRSVANELDAMATKAQSDDMRGRILEMSEAVKLQAAQSEQVFQQSLRADVTQQLATKVIPSKTITVGDVLAQKAKQEGYVDYREMVKEKKVDQFVPAYGGFARSKKDAQEMAVDARDRQAAKNILNKLIDFRKRNKQWNVLNPSQQSYVKALHNELISLKKGRSMDDLGVLAGPDLELLLTSVPKPEDIFSYATPRYKAVIDSINDKERLDIQNRIMPAAPHTIPPIYRRKKLVSETEKF